MPDKITTTVEQIELGTTLTDQNSIHEDIKSRLKSVSFSTESFVFQFAVQKHTEP
jgi:hypothetical protein